MTYIVNTFHIGGDMVERSWGEPFVIGTGDLHDSQVGSQDFLEHMLANSQTHGAHSLGMHITDAGGEVVFTYVRSIQERD